MSQGRLHWKPKSAFPPLKFEANTFVCREDEYLSSAGIITTSSKSGDKTGKSTCSKACLNGLSTCDFESTLRKIIKDELINVLKTQVPNIFDTSLHICGDKTTNENKRETIEKHKQCGEIKTSCQVSCDCIVELDVGYKSGEVRNSVNNSEMTEHNTKADDTAKRFPDGIKISVYESEDFCPVVGDTENAQLIKKLARVSASKSAEENLPDDINTNHNNLTQKSFHRDGYVQDVQFETPRKLVIQKPGIYLSKDDERECMAQALQANVGPLVDQLEFNSSYLPEQMIGAGCITEDECRMIRDDLSRKDQVRHLLCRAKGRDMHDMTTFLKLIEKYVPDVVKKINEVFEMNKRKGVRCTKCALCQCKESIDIKEIIDEVWSIGAIPDGFYSEVVASKKPRGSQDYFWKLFFEVCNDHGLYDRERIYHKLFSALLQRGNFGFIVNPLTSMFERDKILVCKCQCGIKVKSLDTVSIDSWSSWTPRSLTSDDDQHSTTTLVNISGEYDWSDVITCYNNDAYQANLCTQECREALNDDQQSITTLIDISKEFDWSDVIKRQTHKDNLCTPEGRAVLNDEDLKETAQKDRVRLVFILDRVRSFLRRSNTQEHIELTNFIK